MILAGFSCIPCVGQKVLQADLVFTMDNYEWPGIGILNGTAEYRLTIKLSKETGLIESIHWVIRQSNITNELGDKIKPIDSGHATYEASYYDEVLDDDIGMMWDFWNRPNYFNHTVWGGDPDQFYFDVADGWLSDMGIMPDPDELPVEGSFVSMSFKWIYKGVVYELSQLIQIHMNAHGDVTAEVYK